ncbi:uncharacterized protein [Amphiura filiformis]|uniref:uncharacterized protein n=1 Tax=Amphiura filiformis TaxID=82378 RepID=UPI003B223278
MGRNQDNFGERGRKKRKLTHKFTFDDYVIFKSTGKILGGWVKPGDGDIVGPYSTSNSASNDCSEEIHLTSEEKPVKIETCNDVSEIEKGCRVLVEQDQIRNQFREFKVGVVLDFIDNEHVWLRVEDQIQLQTTNCVCLIPNKYKDLIRRPEALDSEEVLRSILRQMCSQLDMLQGNRTLHTDLERARGDVASIQVDYDNILQALTTLQTEHNNTLQTLNTSHEMNKTQQNTIETLTHQTSILTAQISELEDKVKVEEAKAPLLLEKRTGSVAGVLLTRPKGSTGKFTASIQVTLPDHDNPSAEAFQTTLEKRATELMKVLRIISSRDPTHNDVVVTLAAFIRKNNNLIRESADLAGFNWHKELTPAECNDLKLLLRMPWIKFSKLRTFLTNKRLPILASEGKMREQLKTRRTDSIEVGTAQLKKSSTAKPTNVAFVRTTDLEEHIKSLLKLHIQRGNMWDNMKFEGEIWIKIGGDKGGTSTKLAVQICNVKSPNSADNTDLIAFFEALDSDENMRFIFSIYRDPMIKMQGVYYDLGPEFKNMRCRIFLFGDYEFLCKALGHLGACSTFPCLWCHMKLEDLRHPDGQPHCPKQKDAEGNWVDREIWPSDRSVETMANDLQKNTEASARNGKSLKTNSAQFHSVYGSHILPMTVSLDYVVPPILHIMLGLVQRFFIMLERICKDSDNVTVSPQGRESGQKWKDATKRVQELESNLEENQENLKMEDTLLEGFRKSGSGEERGGASAPCDMPACALACVNPWKGKNARDQVKYFQCSQCGDGPGGEEGWFHLSCVGLGISQYNDDSFQFLCPVCEGDVSNAGDVIRGQVKKVEQLKKVVKKAKENYDKAKVDLDKIYRDVCKERGPKETELNRVLEDVLHVKRQAYHSQCFVGNHCRDILKGHNKLIEVLDDEDQEKYGLLFSKLHGILFPYTEARFLTQDEVNELVDKCYDFGTWFPTNFVEETIPPKLHMLVCAVPKCAQMHHTLGLLSEHGLEGVHAQVNADDRTYCRVRDNESRLKLVFRQHGQYAIADKTALRTEKRRCRRNNCKGRFVTVDKVKQCNICYSFLEDTA